MFCSDAQSLLVSDLDPNTNYEFAVRLHVDQLSSPWSPVVYQQTLPEGKHSQNLLNPETLSEIFPKT